MSNFKIGLKEVIKAGLVHEKPYPTTLPEMIVAANRIDNCEYEMSQDRKTSTQPAKKPSNQYRSRQAEPNLQIAVPSTTPNPLNPQNTPWGNSRASSGPPLTSSDGTTPMELDLVGRKGPLTDAQKLYRLEKGLCMYCGEAGHFVQSCTK